MAQKITSKQVAQVAGVSAGTVSRVINNKGYFSEEVREKVFSAMKALDFHVDSFGLQIDKKIIGIAVPEISHPYLSCIVSEIEKHFYSHHYTIVMCNHLYDHGKVKDFIGRLVDIGADGLVMIATGLHNRKQLEEASEQLCIMCINTATQNDECLKYSDYINFSDWQTTFDITEQLIQLGHTKISYMGFHPHSLPTMDRLRGVKDALAKHNIPLVEEYMVQSQTPFVSQSEMNQEELPIQNKLARQLLSLKEPPTAIIAINDYYALGIYSEAQKKGLVIGQDLSVVGYDDIALAQIVHPQLTSVDCNVSSVSYLAATTLMSRIASKKNGYTQEVFNNILVPGVIKKRDSIGSVKKEE